MPTRCCVLDCQSSQNEPKRQTFPFPLSHPELVEKWIEALKFHQSQLTSGAGIVRKRICINHFTSDDLEKFHRLNGEISCIPLNSYKLKPDAVPSVFPGVPHPPIPNIAKQVSNEVPFYPNPDIYEENFNMEKDPIALSANDFYVCQICEATENLIDISGDDKSHFRDELEKLKGIENNKMDLLQYLCQECGNKLMEISILRSQYVITYRKLIAKITPLEESTTEIRVKEEAMEVATTEGTSGMDPTGEDEATDDISVMEYDDDDDGDLWEKMKKSKLKPDIFRKYPNMKCIVKAFDAANVCRIASLVKRAENSKNSRKYYSVKLKDRGFCCLKCDTILMNRHAVMMHKFSHDPQNTQNTKCNICNEEFCSPASTQRHIRVVHEKRKDYECGYCGKRFTERFEVRDHMERHHQGYRYECEMCQKTFMNKRSFNFHKKLHIPEEERTEKVRKSLKKGQTSKLLEKPERQYICPTCGKIFTNQGNFVSHILIHDGKKSHECSVCAKRFLAKNSLKAHMKTHTGEKPYKCEICGNAFRQLGHLNFHLLTHTGEKPFLCPICNKKFTSNGNLTAHKLIHSGEKPLGCRMCEEKFGTYKALREHYRQTHFPDFDLPTGADIKNKLREVLGDD